MSDKTEVSSPSIALLDRDEAFRTLTQALPALVFVSDVEGRNVYTNSQFQEYVGRSADALLGEGWLETLHPGDRQRAAETWNKAVRSRGPYEAEYRFRRHDGVYRWFLVRGVAARDATGRIESWYGTCTDVHEAKEIAEALSDEKDTLETLNRLGQVIAAELDLQRAVQAVTDAATDVTGASFGAFFYNVVRETGEAYTLYTLSGVPREAFARFAMPRNTAVFGPTFSGGPVLRSEDITKDPRYGHNAPYRGMPEGHLPVRSYLAVPVTSRSGEVLGGLFFGHPDPGVFTARSERLVLGIAAQAAIAIDNARLYEAAQRENEQRARVQAALQESERRLNAVLDNATVAVFLMDSTQRCVYMNSAAEKLTGYTLADAHSRPLHDLIHHTRPDGSSYPIEECPIDRAFPQNNQQQGEEIFVHKDGTFFPVAFTASPIHDEHADVVGTIIEVRDIRAEKDAALALREADNRKDEFLAVLAHELRNPLAPIRNGVQIMRQRASGDESTQRVVQMMDRQITHVVRLVDDLLDVSRITRGKLELKRQRVQLAIVVSNAVEASRTFIETYGHDLVVEVNAPELTVDGDPDRLAQVLSNLLSNSAKYTDRGGRIVLRLGSHSDEAVVEIQDNGLGIPAEQLENIFEMFSQGTDRHGSKDGLGIGLSLARRLVEMHGGTITAYSAGLGSGSTFTIRLPLARSVTDTAIERENVGLRHADTAQEQRAKRRIRALVVDDNTDAAASLAMLLEMEGLEVRTAADGEEAVETAREFAPEMIFMDIGMPRMDGIEATRRIRALPQGRDIFIAALTGWGQAHDRERTREAGMDEHLVKPVSYESLAGVLAVRNAPGEKHLS